MSSQQAGQNIVEDPELEKRVCRYLLQNPDFFARNTAILAAIQVPHLIGDAASLIEHQVRILRKQLESERNRLTHLISRAREYEALAKRMHALVLQLIAAKDSAQLHAVLSEAMLRELSAEAVALKLFPVNAENHSLRDALTDAFCDFVDRDHALCGPLDAAKGKLLFGEGGGAMRAAALVPIRADDYSGVLAIGSSDPDRFHPDMGTDFLDQLGEVLSHKLRSMHLDLASEC